MNERKLIEMLYQSVDDKNIDHLATFLAQNVRFRIANYDPVIGLEDVLAANRTFFNSIKSMKHQIDGVWAQGNEVLCNGKVDYIRLDDSAFSATFATILSIEDDTIVDYLVYADISGL